MKKLIFLICMMLLLILPSCTQKDYFQCENSGLGGMCIEVVFKSDSDRGQDFRDFNFPHNLKLGDKFWVERFTFHNQENQTTKKQIYTLDIQPDGGHIEQVYTSNYGTYLIAIPPLKPYGKYEIIKNQEAGYKVFLDGKYNRTYTHWKMQLYKSGNWIITDRLEDMNYEKSYSSLFNGRWRTNVFLVKITPILKGWAKYWNFIKENAISLTLGILSLIIAISSIIVAIRVPHEVAKWELKKKREYDDKIQQDLLKGIATQIEIIEDNAKGQKREMGDPKQTYKTKQTPKLPSYLILDFDRSVYLTNLRSEINGEPTYKLKKLIALVSEKIENISLLVKLGQQYDSLRNSNIEENPHFKELKYIEPEKGKQHVRFKYHEDLAKRIQKLKDELEKFLKNKN